MTNLLLRHIIGEVAIDALFKKIEQNWRKPDTRTLLQQSGIVHDALIDSIENGSIKDDIDYFKRLEQRARDPHSMERYREMAQHLEDAQNIYFRFVKFGELPDLIERR